MKRVLRSCLLVAFTCMLFAITSTAPVSAKKVAPKKVTLTKPKIVSVKKLNNTTIRVKWKKVKKAKKYEIFASVNGGKFKKVGKVAKAYFDHKTAIQGGVTYAYKIKAVKGKTKSKYSKKIKITIPKSFSSDPKTNFNNLINLINTHKSVDASGNHYLKATIKNNSTKNIFIVTVKNNKLNLYCSTETDSGVMVSVMEYGIDEITNDSAVVETTITTKKGVKAKGHASIKPSIFSSHTTLNYTIDSSNTSNSLQSTLNSHAYVMILGCNGNLNSFIGSINLKNIGFTSL